MPDLASAEASQAIADRAVASSRHANAGRGLAAHLQAAAQWCLLATLALAAVLSGLQLRRIAWEGTEAVRYTGDIDNAFYQGTTALREGFFDAYDDVDARKAPFGAFSLDYAPARLAIMTLWTRHVRLRVDGPPENWHFIPDWPRGFYQRAWQLHATYALCRPLLWFNDAVELLAAAGAFALVRRWLAPARGQTAALWLALLAAVALWFNPALIWDAHVWPQWDAWLLPFVLWALVAASDGWWFVAGALVAGAALFKAQVLLGAPLLILWPLSRGQLGAAARSVSGFAAGLAAGGAPWLVRVDHATSWAAIGWVAGVAAAVGVLYLLPRLRSRWLLSAAALLAAALICWPLWRLGGTWLIGGVVATAALSAAVLLLRRQALCLGAAAVAAALLLCPAVFGSSMAWLAVGLVGGGQANVLMSAGPNANLPTLLESQYGWATMNPVFTLPAGQWSDAVGGAAQAVDRHYTFTPGKAAAIPMRYVLVGAYLLLLAVCSVAAGVHAARSSPRFLLAVATPWVLLYVLLPHMHERYLLWGACMGALTWALSPGWALLDLFLSTVAVSNMLARVDDPGFRHLAIIKCFSGWTPGIGWAVLLAAAVMLYGTLCLDRPRRRWRSTTRPAAATSTA